jgi:hypothetical protein
MWVKSVVFRIVSAGSFQCTVKYQNTMTGLLYHHFFHSPLEMEKKMPVITRSTADLKLFLGWLSHCWFSM